MNRLYVLYYWLFKEKNNVSLKELIQIIFLRPSANARALRYINEQTLVDNYYEISFKNKQFKLYWPLECPQNNINMMVCETFDNRERLALLPKNPH
jgi:hypothetical protein